VALAATLSYCAFFLAHGFWPLLILGFIALSLTQAVTPLVEAMTLRATAEGRISYGAARGVGSISFIIANIVGGLMVARFGVGAVVVWIIAGLAITALTSWVSLQPDPSQHAHSGAKARLGAVGDLLRNRRFIIGIVACGLIQSGHAFYYGFSTLVWRGQGIGPDMVGYLWAFGVAVEVAFLWSLPLIERRVGPEALITAGAIGGVVRWTLLGFAPVGFVLWPLQALHMLSFAAAHVGAMRLIYREAPPAAAAMAQTIYAALSAGILMGGSTLLSGVLYDLGGARGYWAMAALAGLGGALSVLLFLPARRAARSG
ncbi:MAG: MFS transporter, partial [Hyphomonadaceae bacterium]